MNPYYASQEDERHGRHCHHTVVDIASIVNSLRDNLETKQGAGAEKFTYECNDNENHTVTHTIGKTIDK